MWNDNLKQKCPRDPWGLVFSLEPALADVPLAMVHERVVEDFTPHSGLSPFDAAPFLAHFAQSPRSAEPLYVYALIDGGRSAFLPDRLELSGLDHVCLYDVDHLEDEGESAPWLVALEWDTKFAKAGFAYNSESNDPRMMFGDGIWLSSALDLAGLRAHLRRFTKLTDENGVTEFFRLQEPGMLDALLCASSAAVRQKFFAGVDRIFYPWPTLQRGIWDIVGVGLDPSADATLFAVPGATATTDKTTRAAMRRFVEDRTARLLAIEAIPLQQERWDARCVFFRMLNAGFDYEPRLIEAFRLVQKLPPEAETPFWRDVNSGHHSPRIILLTYAEHYNIKGILEGFDE
jgi:hypothetical protein